MAVEIKNLTITLGRFHLGPLTKSFSEGSIHLITGENGAGKTSLLKVLLGRLKPSSGEIKNKTIPLGAVGIEPLLMDSWSVKDNISWYVALAKRNLRNPKLLERLKPLLAQPVSELSRGLQRQVELSLVLSQDFSLYLFDEPFAHLDQSQQKFYQEEIQTLSKENRIVILSTHQKSDLSFSTLGEIVELS